VTRDLLDLLPVPDERDLPAGRVEVRRAELVAAISSDATPSRLRGWLTSVGLLVASLAVVCSVLFAGDVRPPGPEAAAKSAVVLAGGSGLVALAAAVPRPPRLVRS
jgi:hypothetical protein